MVFNGDHALIPRLAVTCILPAVRDLARMMSTFVVGDDGPTNFDKANTAR